MDEQVWTTFKVGKDKIVSVFRAFDLTGHLINYPFKCNSYIYSKVPEVDAFEWVEAEDALEIVTNSQIRLFSEVIKRRKEDK